MRQIGARVHHLSQRVAQDRNAGAGLDGIDRDVPPERTRSWYAMEGSEDVTRHGMQPRAARKLALDMRKEGFERLPRSLRRLPPRDLVR